MGLPFKACGRTREEGVDCWGLVRLYYLEQFAIELPAYDNYQGQTLDTIREDLGRTIVAERDKSWRPCAPIPGAVIHLRIDGYPYHLGIVLDRRRMLHTMEGIGACIEYFDQLAWTRRVLGFYEYVG